MTEIVIKNWASNKEALVSLKYDENNERNRCDAQRRNGVPCRNWALDNGRCKFHGGRDIDDVRLDPDNPRNVPGRPPTHGKYSKYLRHDIADRYEEFLGDKDFLNLQDEIAYMRSVTSRLLNAIEDEAMTDGQVDGLVKLADGVRKLSESYMKIETQKKYALNPDEVMRILTTVVQIITKHVEDQDTILRIKDELLSINI